MYSNMQLINMKKKIIVVKTFNKRAKKNDLAIFGSLTIP
jgi:hypothetical protein